MTLREALIQAHMEMGKSREEAEFRLKASDAALPGARLFSYIPLTSAAARQFIEITKRAFRQMDAHPELKQYVVDQVNKRAKHN